MVIISGVRPYQLSDYEAVKDLYVSGEIFGGQFDEDRDSRERLQRQIQRDPNSVLVAVDGTRILGTVSILKDDRFAWLMRFAVQEQFEDAVADALFRSAAELLTKEGHTQVLVYAPAGSEKFKKRYRKLGFVEGETYGSYWRKLV